MKTALELGSDLLELHEMYMTHLTRLGIAEGKFRKSAETIKNLVETFFPMVPAEMYDETVKDVLSYSEHLVELSEALVCIGEDEKKAHYLYMEVVDRIED